MRDDDVSTARRVFVCAAQFGVTELIYHESAFGVRVITYRHDHDPRCYDFVCSVSRLWLV
jgi:hypothetical protein